MAEFPGKKTADDMGGLIQGTLHKLGDDAAHLSDRAYRAVGATSGRASALMGDLAHETSVRSQRAARLAVREVREHPMATLAVGAAIGLLVSAYLMRRR
ncbi:MAG: hypothetical protein SGJ21_03815 [Alphaproteobacteria bacterium]|nr:hypothetical protein [Alphaproteobacteria bacterium]